MAMSRRGSCVEAMLGGWGMPAMDRLWWWLALLSLMALLGQEIVRTSAIALATASISDFEGFGDEWEEIEEEPLLVAPPPAHRRPGFETDRGPPPPPQDAIPVDPTETLAPPVESTDSVSSSSSPSSKTLHRHEYWDEDEFEGLPEEHPPSHTAPDQVELSSDSASASSIPKATPPIGPRNFYIEVACIFFLIFFAIAYFLGKKENENIALAWAAQFAGKNGIFDKNFSLLGTSTEPDSPVLIKEGQNIFKFYASGRRFCRGLLATMDLQCRHDLITCMWYFVSPRKDEITIDVFMNDENMEPFTFALVRKKNVKTILKDWKDLQTYAGAQVQRTGLSEELAIIAEFRDLAYDVVTETALDQVFGEKAFERFGKHFVSMHFTDEFPSGAHKRILQFKFTLPSINSMGDMSRLIALVPYYIDLLGRYKLSTQLRAKADAARAKVAQEAFKEAQTARQEASQKRKQERRKAFESVDSKLSVEAIRKREEKERLRQMKKSMPRIKISRA
ncbi:hypothetical protein GOP47_0007735 [Adiantum capillus-veneris]|uniref:Coiled-coil domain-containing protein 47 n=1 Tax=Adiantum capillus-veneris TaxID=13818 RepID=A0A9D4V198_ADICA|nr:hypothetical protein GOP47_0007735 [Adiantum capillus-veneris]